MTRFTLDMGVELALPALASGESGMELSFEGSSDGQSDVEAFLQANLNGMWQNVSSGVLGGTRYENVRVPLSPTGISGIFATATKLPFSGGGSTVVFDKTPTSIDVTVANGDEPVDLGTEFELPALSGSAVGLDFTFRATTIGQESIDGFLQYYDAGKKEWQEPSHLIVEEGSIETGPQVGGQHTKKPAREKIPCRQANS